MKPTDYISLALKGWSLADIKELKSMEMPEEMPEETEGATGEDITETVDTEVTKDVTENVTETNDTDINIHNISDEVDYKALYEKSQAELHDLQKINISKDISAGSEKPPEETLGDIVRNFY